MKAFLAGLLLMAGAAGAAEPDFGAIAARAGGVAGVSAVHIESGRRFSLNAETRFPLASVCKLPLAVAILGKADEGTLRLDSRLRKLLEASLQRSDNPASDELFRMAGGPKAVEARVQALGIAGLDLSRNEARLAADYRRSRRRFETDARDTATPAAVTALLVKIQRGEALKPGTANELLATMQGCKTGDNRIRALLPPGTLVADKTGTIGGTVNDVGLITLPGGAGHVAIAVLLKGVRDRAAGERAIAEIARAVFDGLMPARTASDSHGRRGSPAYRAR